MQITHILKHLEYMGSQTLPLKLPIIDFGEPDLKPGSPSWDSIRGQVRRALEDYGCFEAFYPKVPLDLRKRMFSCLNDLFDLPLQTKVRNSSKKPYHGYVGQYPMVPLYESLGVEGADMSQKVDEFVTLIWPEGNPTFSKSIHSYSKELSDLDKIVRRMVLESIGVEKYLEEHMASTNYLLRVQKYKGPESTEPKLGINSHTDKNIVTILYQNEVDGLEVKTKDGEWINVHCSPDSFIVMIGDSLHAWSNGLLYSAFHRVMMTGNEARYSLGLFSIPKAGYKIKAPEEFVDKDHPLLFKPYDHIEFLSFYYTAQGQRLEQPLKAYCGA